jgi:hypothetical protein
LSFRNGNPCLCANAIRDLAHPANRAIHDSVDFVRDAPVCTGGIAKAEPDRRMQLLQGVHLG